jgi:tRNA dimethylallyltransferase
MNEVAIVCGPTASGKSALALRLAQIFDNAVIVNADSMQLYKDIQIIAASPTKLDKAQVTHKLYGILEATDYCSVAEYVNITSKLIQGLLHEGKKPIIVGGTGMYINALMFGYSPIPDIDPNLRKSARVKLKEWGNERFFKELTVLDPQITNKLHAGDSQRILRAYEVIMQSGKSIIDYHVLPPIQPLPAIKFKVYMLNPERNFLYDTCNNRFHQLIKNGAIEEVEALLHLGLPEETQTFKALGVREIIEYVEGNTSLKDAISVAQTKTRQYAKRQVTWFTHQIEEKQIISYNSFAEYDKILQGLNTDNF